MRVLVTGDAGFIGSKLALRLVDKGYEVVGVDIRNIPYKLNYKHITGDLADWSVVESLGNFEIIFRIAGHSAGDMSIQYYESDIRDNILSTANIIKLAKLTNAKQIIYASSMAVYGDQETYPVTEDMYPIPRVYYGVNKFASEQYLRIANSSTLHTTSIRLFNIYGPGQDVNNLTQGMVSIFIGEFLQNPNIIMRGSPERFRDFLFVDEAVDAFMLCVRNKKIAGQVINVGLGKKHTIGELVKIIQSKLQFETSVKYGEPTNFDLNYMHGDITKAKKLLGFNPKIDIEEGIEKTLKWVIKNYYKKIDNE